VLAVQNATEGSSTYSMTTSFDAIEPMPWALGRGEVLSR